MTAPVSATTPETLTDLIRDFLDKMRNGIQSALQKAADILNNIGDASWFGGLLTGLGVGWVIDRFNDGVKQIWEAFTTACAKVWDFIGDVLGRPLELQHLAEVYTRTQSVLVGLQNTIKDDTVNLGIEWEGKAYTAYSQVSDAQGLASAEVASLLSEVGALVSGQAKALLDLWTDLLTNIAQTTIAAVTEIADAADIGNLATFAAGPGVKALLAVASGLVDAAATFVKYVTGDATTTTQAWLDANVGGTALPNVAWPVTSAALLGRIDDDGQWEKTPA